VGVQIPRNLHSQVPQEDAVRGTAQAPGGGVSQVSFAKGKQDRRGSSYARSRAYVDFDPTEIRGVTGGWIHQGKERDPSGQGVWREETEFCRSTLLGLFVSIVGRDETSIREYIRNQEQEDMRLDQMNLWR